jgi:hypothetical protein
VHNLLDLANQLADTVERHPVQCQINSSAVALKFFLKALLGGLSVPVSLLTALDQAGARYILSHR